MATVYLIFKTIFYIEEIPGFRHIENIYKNDYVMFDIYIRI